MKQELIGKIEKKTKELTQKSTEEILQKAEEKKRTAVEDDIRARLRGFARTIPSFLMAYGKQTTTLANFDESIKNEVFKEVTGITLDQFRALRDTYNFFDQVVFDESVQEFLHKKAELANYFDESKNEDIFDYIPPQRTNQIYTPKKVVKLMIDKLEEENPELFTDKDRTFADLYVKSGLFLTEIVKRLFAGLEAEIPDNDVRLKHILENQVYGFAPSEIIYNIARNFVFSGFADISDSHLQCRDLTETAKDGGNLGMKFDVVVGNPPYQDESVKSNGSGAIGEVLSTPLIGFTETFISIGAFDNEVEAQNCLKYVKSKFARTMLGILKVTQDNPRDKWSKVPLQDFTPQSDIDWTQSIPDIDRQLYEKYGLDEKEIAFIEEKVKVME